MPNEGLRFSCSGCGASLPADTRTPFVCPDRDAADGIDHIIERHLSVRAPMIDRGAAHPFLRYRKRLSSYVEARRRGWTEAQFASLVGELDAAVADVDGRGFHRSAVQALAAATGQTVRAKLELFGVAGSHKARHLFGLMLWLRVQEQLSQVGGDAARPRLAIASCGNAALAAAVVARAARWPIAVFVPADADAAVLRRLRGLDAEVVVCARQAGVAGDPTVARFRAAVAAGALPFCCQGTDNGLTIEGGETLGWELAEDIAEDIAERGAADTLWVQVGGGALATGCWRGLRDAHRAGEIATLPRLMTVQTTGAWPLGRAWLRFVAELVGDPTTATRSLDPAQGGRRSSISGLAAAAGDVWRADRAVHARRLARRWRRFMTPWPTAPHSVAHGILDDETYDGRALIEAMLDTGGWPVVASEAHLVAAAAELGGDLPVTATGAAGLAGLRQEVARAAEVGADDGAVGTHHMVLLTGLKRAAD